MLQMMRHISGDITLALRAGGVNSASAILTKTAKKTTTKTV
ncbi:hypothetical protein [Martelella radicis]|uniref:Uncharacterized protein n=1 Tax=Martelella radicis TaxID=1397476 RepID=A0A7W6KK87_9HYPH|nr:hypothetical protein [Martelella radicis]MBB4122550.1 hypothetical protein [Martelella radicis]